MIGANGLNERMWTRKIHSSLPEIMSPGHYPGQEGSLKDKSSKQSAILTSREGRFHTSISLKVEKSSVFWRKFSYTIGLYCRLVYPYCHKKASFMFGSVSQSVMDQLCFTVKDESLMLNISSLTQNVVSQLSLTQVNDLIYTFSRRKRNWRCFVTHDLIPKGCVRMSSHLWLCENDQELKKINVLRT